MPLNANRLWIVATPLGNPGDLSPRAREVLASADLVLAEDTRRTARLLRECGIETRRLLSFHDHNETERQEGVLRLLREGQCVALVSDAGTPLLADPGYRLVRACRKEGLAVSPLPGPSAPVTALSAAGIPPLPHSFLGFLPRDASGRDALFTAFAHVPGALIFFERKDRLKESLAQAARILGPRELAVCRELTKEHEEFIVGRLEESDQLPDELLEEIGWSRTEAELVSHWYLLDRNINTQAFETILAYNDTHNAQTSVQRLANAFQNLGQLPAAEPILN